MENNFKSKYTGKQIDNILSSNKNVYQELNGYITNEGLFIRNAEEYLNAGLVPVLLEYKQKNIHYPQTENRPESRTKLPLGWYFSSVVYVNSKTGLCQFPFYDKPYKIEKNIIGFQINPVVDLCHNEFFRKISTKIKNKTKIIFEYDENRKITQKSYSERLYAIVFIDVKKEDITSENGFKLHGKNFPYNKIVTNKLQFRLRFNCIKKDYKDYYNMIPNTDFLPYVRVSEDFDIFTFIQL